MSDPTADPDPAEYGRLIGQLIAGGLDTARARTAEPYRPVAEDDDED